MTQFDMQSLPPVQPVQPMQRKGRHARTLSNDDWRSSVPPKPRHARTPSFNDEWATFAVQVVSPPSQQQEIVRPQTKTEEFDMSSLANPIQRKPRHARTPSINEWAASTFQEFDMSDLANPMPRKPRHARTPSIEDWAASAFPELVIGNPANPIPLKARHARTPSIDDWAALSFQEVSPSPQQQMLTAQPQKKTEELDINDLETKDDLAALKKKDPFMYYSIPSIKDAAYVFDDVELSNITEKSSMRRNCISCPSRMQTESESSRSAVRRRTRISFECHSGMFDSDMLTLDEEEEETKQEGGNMDYLLIMMEKFGGKR